MTTVPDERRVEVATRASGLLRSFNRAGLLDVGDVQVAQRVAWLAQESSSQVQLALAFVVRALRLGSVCVTLSSLRADVERSLDAEPPADLSWPEPTEWSAGVAASPMVTLGDEGTGGRPLRLVDGQLYLERSWEQQEDVRQALVERAANLPVIDEGRLEASASDLFDGRGLKPGETDRQREAAVAAVRQRVLVLAGGPGTGKTTTIARLLVLLNEQFDRPPRISLAAPSGKAAARLQEAVQTELGKLDLPPQVASHLRSLRGVTLHRLLGAVPGRRVKYDASNPLPADVVVVDETSMVSLSQMAQLLAAVRPDARLVLVGDPDQLASIDAGAVLSDISAAVETRGVPLPHVRLTHTWRYGGAIGDLADAVRRGDLEQVTEVLDGRHHHVRLVQIDDQGELATDHLAALRHAILPTTLGAVRAAIDGDAAAALALLRRHRVLCAHRTGPQNTQVWNARIESWLADALPGYDLRDDRYAGQPLLVTRNDPDLGISNGDTGIVIHTPRGLRAALDLGGQPLLLSPAQLDSVEVVHAMTVHKAQGSQFDAVTVVLPVAGSPLLTRELLYTAVTRASTAVTIVAQPAALEQAVTRQALRASGLRTRL